MKLKKIALCLLIACCIGCFSDKVDIRADQRIEVKGRISNGQAFNELSVFSFAGYDLLLYNDYERFGMLGRGRLDNAGNFNFVSLVPQSRKIHLVLNTNFSESFNDHFESVFILVENYKDNEVEIPAITLREVAKIKLTLKNNSGIDGGSYQIIYTRPGHHLIYENGSLNEIEEVDFNTGRISGEIFNEEDIEEELSSLEGLEVKILLNYGEEQEEHIFTIEPGLDNYEIEL